MVYYKDFSKTFERAAKAAISDLTSDKSLKSLGNEVAADIKKRTQLGYGVEKNGDEKTRLRKILPSTKKQRKKLSEQGKLSSFTSPGKTNLTRTGNMLDSIRVFAFSGKIFIKMLRKASYATFVDEARSFFKVSRQERKRLVKSARILTLNALKRRLKISK